MGSPATAPKNLGGPRRNIGAGKAQKSDTDTSTAAPVPTPGLAQPSLPFQIHLPIGYQQWFSQSPNQKKDAADSKAATSGLGAVTPELLLPGFATMFPDPAKASALGSAVAAATSASLAEPLPNNPAARTKAASENSNGSTSTSKTSAGEGGPAAPAELAFAAKVRPVQATNQPEQNASRGSSEQSTLLGTSGIKKAEIEEIEKEPAPGSNSLPNPQSLAANFDRGSEPPPAASPAQAAAPVQHAEAPAPAESAAKSVQPLKELSMQVSEPHQQKVEVRMVDQAGELRVSVHTGDSDLVHGLRQGLPELVGKLEDTGFKAETWRPAESAGPAAPTAETKNASNNSRNDDSQSQSGWSQQQSGGQRNQNQSNRPRWVEEMESSLSGGTER